MPLALPWPLEEYRAISLGVAYEKASAFWQGGFNWNPPGLPVASLFETDAVHREKWRLIEENDLPRDVDDADGNVYSLSGGQQNQFHEAFTEHTRDAINALIAAVVAIKAAPDTATIDAVIDALPEPN